MYRTVLSSLGFAALAAAGNGHGGMGNMGGIGGMGRQQQGLVAALQQQPDLSTLLGALQDVPEVAGVLAAASNITILAPTNDAFAKIPARSPVGTALANKEADAIAALLAYHVVSGSFLSTDFMEAPQYVSTLLVAYEVNGESVTNVTGGQNVGLQLNGSDATILSGEMMSSVVVEADIHIGGIIVHKIDTVLTLPVKASAQAQEAGLTGIVDALTQANLVETVDTTPDLTVFIPSNKAFAALGTGYQGLDTQALTNILTYHVIAGNVLFSPELSNTTVPSLQGTDLTVTVLGDAVFINEAQVIIPNIIIANGVAHVIDQVLNPDDTEVDVDSLSVSATNNTMGGGGGNANTGNNPARPPMGQMGPMGPMGAGNATPTANETGMRGPNATATSTAPAVYTGAAAVLSNAGLWVQGSVMVALTMFTM